MHTHTYTHTRAYTYAFLECLSLHETCEGHGVARKPLRIQSPQQKLQQPIRPETPRAPAPAACSAPSGGVSAAPAWLPPPLLLSLPSLALRARSPAVPSPVGRRRPPPLPSLDSCPQAPAHPYNLSWNTRVFLRARALTATLMRTFLPGKKRKPPSPSEPLWKESSWRQGGIRLFKRRREIWTGQNSAVTSAGRGRGLEVNTRAWGYIQSLFTYTYYLHAHNNTYM